MTEIDDRTYYELLGLERDATTEAIKEAYREIARIYHPDSNFYSDIIADAGPDDSDVFKAITAAYQVLINEEKRKVYDESLPKDLATWDDGDDSEGPRTAHEFARAETSHSGPIPSEEIPEDWRKEREYFEQHFEEILKPAPKVNLISSAENVGEDGSDGMVEDWEPATSPSEVDGDEVNSGFGSLASTRDLGDFASVPSPRRRIAAPRYSLDPVALIMYVGIPVMGLIVIAELIYFRMRTH